MVILLEIKPKITNILEEHSYTRLISNTMIGCSKSRD